MSTETDHKVLSTKLDNVISNQKHIRLDFKEVVADIKKTMKEIDDKANENTTAITTMKGIYRASAIWSAVLAFAISTLIGITTWYSSYQAEKPSIDVLQTQVGELFARQDKLDTKSSQVLEILTNKGDKNVR